MFSLHRGKTKGITWKKEVCPLKRNKIRIFLGTMLTISALLGGCTCRASVKPVATAVPTQTATMEPVATALITVVPEPSGTPMASESVSPSMSPMTSEGTGSGTP